MPKWLSMLLPTHRQRTTHVRRIPKRWRPLQVEVGERYERALATATPSIEWEIETPSAEDLIFLATHDLAVEGTETGETLLPAAPFAFSASLAAALRTLSAEGRVVFADSAGFDPQLVWRTVEQERVVTLTIGGDAYARPLLAALPTATSGRSPTTLRTISSSGAPLGLDVARALGAALPDVTILDEYEAPEQNAPGAPKMIRPSDVEARLRKHSSVSDCVVVGISDPRIGKTVVALVQIAEGHYLDAPEVAAWCQAHLPSTMTPGRFLFVEKIERSASGEADYQALRGSRSTARARAVATQTARPNAVRVRPAETEERQYFRQGTPTPFEEPVAQWVAEASVSPRKATGEPRPARTMISDFGRKRRRPKVNQRPMPSSTTTNRHGKNNANASPQSAKRTAYPAKRLSVRTCTRPNPTMNHGHQCTNQLWPT